MNRYKIDKVWGHTHPKIELHPEGVWVLYVDAQSQAAEIEQLKAENKQLRAALDKTCEAIETQPRVGAGIDYANGFHRGAQAQRMAAWAARSALKETTT